MTFLLALIPLCVVAMGGTTLSLAEEMELPPYEGSPALKTMKSLAGTWKGTHILHGKEVPASIEYKVSSNGSTVVETMFPGSPHEMVNVYHDKSGKLAMTHYCSMGNQPHLDLVAMEGVDRFVPVDIYVPGCPPTPEALFDGILKLQDRIMQKRVFTKQPEQVKA